MTGWSYANTERVQLRKVATREVGYNTQDVADALGVTLHTVQGWIRRGRLLGTKTDIMGKSYWTFSGFQIIRFLMTDGCFRQLAPKGEWAKHYEVAVARMRREYIGTAELSTLIHNTHPHELVRAHGLPPASVKRVGGYGVKNYWRRSDVREWLASHPQYDPSGLARKELLHVPG